MNKLYKTCLLVAGAALAQPARAQYFTNAGARVMVQAGAALYVGPGGLANQAGGVVANAGAVRVDGPVANPGLLDLSTGALELRGDFTNTGTVLPGSSSVTFSGAADQTLVPGGATLYQVMLNKPTPGANALRLGGDLTVSNLLLFSNGVVNTRAGAVLHTLHLPHGATLSGEAAGRYVAGALEITRTGIGGTTAVDFGHGAELNALGNVLGTVSITRTAGLLASEVSYGTNLGTSAGGIDRIWTVSPASQPAPGIPVQLAFSWLPDNDRGLAGFAQAQAWQQPAPGQAWAAVGPVADASARRLVVNTTALSRFTVSNLANPLPVTLVDFTAQAEGAAAVRLAWATASEWNNARFGVERSTDGYHFAEVGALAGAGTSTARRTYAWLDAQLPAAAHVLYYRLAQADRTGGVHYSPVRAVRRIATAAGFVVYPTRLAVGQAATYLYTGPAQGGSLQVLDLLGRPVRVVAVDGRAQGPVPLSGLSSGTYLLRYVTAAGSFGGRCVVE